jgi:hypothetical protein
MKKLRPLLLVFAVLGLAACGQSSVTRSDLTDAIYEFDQSVSHPCQPAGANTAGTGTGSTTTATPADPNCNGITLEVQNCVADKLFADNVSQSTRDAIGHATSIDQLSDSEQALVNSSVSDCQGATGSSTTTTSG